MYIYIYVCMYVCMYVCVCVYVYKCICIYRNYLHGSLLVSHLVGKPCVCVCARARAFAFVVCVCVCVCVLGLLLLELYMRCFRLSRKHLHPTELSKRASSLCSCVVCVCVCVCSKQDTLPVGTESWQARKAAKSRLFEAQGWSAYIPAACRQRTAVPYVRFFFINNSFYNVCKPT